MAPIKPRPSRALPRMLALAVAIFAGWFILKEAIEPHWSIRLGDLVSPGPPPEALTLGDGLALHLYPDTRPHVGKITPLQKGLALVHEGQELIEEAYGFGAPIVINEGRSYLSQNATIEVIPDRGQAVKRFTIDVEDTWTRHFRRKYRPVEPLGEITFTYTVVAPGVIDVEADFTGLRVQPERVYLTNEQGATYFTHFSDSDGTAREFIDAPDTPDQWLPNTAAETCLESPTRGLRFCVETAPGQPKFVGRERYAQYRWSGIFWLSWAGSDIELTRPRGTYYYRVRVEPMPPAP